MASRAAVAGLRTPRALKNSSASTRHVAAEDVGSTACRRVRDELERLRRESLSWARRRALPVRGGARHKKKDSDDDNNPFAILKNLQK